MAKVYDLYANPLFGIIMRIIKNQGLAEEILQQTMMKVWNKIDTYDSERSNFFTWIATIARNTAIDKKRLKSFENIQKTDSLDSTVYEVEIKGENHLQLDIEKITAALDPKYKLLIDKLYLEGYSQRDLADELDMPVGTIKTRIRTAMNILREEFKDERKYFLGMLLLSILILLCL